jgi:hypothetical protein
LGQDRIVVPVFGRFEDPGVTATDESGVPPVISQSPLFINTNATGETVITYTATDGSGNSASVQRTVAVGDFIAPTIQLIGPSFLSVERGSWLSEIDPGVLVSDNYDSPQDITILIDSTDYDKDRAGTYMILYRARDRAGNLSTTRVRIVELTFGVGLAKATSNANTLMLYPNPTKGLLHLGVDPSTVKQLLVYDALGRVIMTHETMKESVISLNELENGVYHIVISTENGNYSNRVVLSK